MNKLDELKEYTGKEEIINDRLYNEKIIYSYSFEEIDFENELITFTEERTDPEYGGYDVESHEIDFDELVEFKGGDLLDGLLKLFKEYFN